METREINLKRMRQQKGKQRHCNNQEKPHEARKNTVKHLRDP